MKLTFFLIFCASFNWFSDADSLFSPRSPLKNALCDMQHDLLSSSSGDYIKTACKIDEKKSIADGTASCESFGMKIFDADDGNDSWDALAAAAGSLIPNTPGSIGWIGGTDANGSCSVIAWTAMATYERQYVPCSGLKATVCENFVRPKPYICTDLQEVFDTNGEYVKTLCYVGSSQTAMEIDNTCTDSTMALANSNEFVDDLRSFAEKISSVEGSFYLRTSSDVNCTVLVKDGANPVYTVLESNQCLTNRVAFCEYNDTIPQNVMRRQKPFICEVYKPVYDVNGAFVKNLCLVSSSKYDANFARIICLSNNMKLASSDEYVEELKVLAFARYPTGGVFWTNDTDATDCTALVKDAASLEYTFSQTELCTTTNRFFCEYK